MSVAFLHRCLVYHHPDLLSHWCVQSADSSPGWQLSVLPARRAGCSDWPELPRFVFQPFQLYAPCPGEAQRHGEALSGRKPALCSGYSRTAMAACSPCRSQVNIMKEKKDFVIMLHTYIT